MAQNFTKAKLFQFWGRAETGKMMSENDWNLEYYWPRLVDLCKKYKLDYNKDEVVPQDTEIADNVFKAAYELIVDLGVLCQDTERIIKLEADEIDEALRMFPSETILGEGKDAITIKHRNPEDTHTPNVLARVLGPQDPDLLYKIFVSYCKEPRIDHCHFQGIIPRIFGHNVKPGNPFEMAAEIRRMTELNAARRDVGRPGMHDGASSTVTLQGQLVAYDNRWGMRDGDARQCYIMPHLKTSYEQMSRVYACHALGKNLWGLGQAFVGGLAGSPMHAAVVCTAELLAYVTLYQPTYLGIWPADAIYFSTTSRTALFTNFHCGMAWARNTNTFAVTGNPWGIVCAGPCTEEYFWEHAAGNIGNVNVGLNCAGGTGWQSGKVNGATGIGARFAHEVGSAGVGLGVKEANRLVNECLKKYEERMVARTLHQIGKPFEECYDLESITPTQEYTDIYNNVKAELKDMGLSNLGPY